MKYASSAWASLAERNGAEPRLEAAVVQRDTHPQFAHGGQPAEIDGGQFPQAHQLLAPDPRGVKVGGRAFAQSDRDVVEQGQAQLRVA